MVNISSYSLSRWGNALGKKEIAIEIDSLRVFPLNHDSDSAALMSLMRGRGPFKPGDLGPVSSRHTLSNIEVRRLGVSCPATILDEYGGSRIKSTKRKAALVIRRSAASVAHKDLRPCVNHIRITGYTRGKYL
jgi:hypothetical protein